jgi:hypothetical protein
VVLTCFHRCADTCVHRLERFSEHVEPIRRLVALFGLYTFYFTQPEGTQIPLYSTKHIDIALGGCCLVFLGLDVDNSTVADQYELFLGVPKTVSPMLAPYASQVVSTLVEAKAFYVLPVSGLGSYNPRTLPREVFVEDMDEMDQSDARMLPLESEVDPPVTGLTGTQDDTATPTKVPKKKGRPSKRDMAKRAKDAVAGLDRWLDRTESTSWVAGGIGTGPSRARSQALLSHPPAVSRTNYWTQKTRVLDALLENEGSDGVEALERANVAVLARLKKIDAMAAEKGMEVGGEGGELTGLGRVERAVGELGTGCKGGILGLSDGAGTLV